MSDQTKSQLEKLRTRARKLDKEARVLTKDIVQGPMKLSRGVILPVVQLELFKYMETTYTSWSDWAIDLGLSRSTAFDWKKVAEALADLDDKDYYELKMANARLLAKLAPKQRTESMIHKAKTMTEEDFLAVVNKVKKDNGEMELDSRVTFKARCYEGQKQIIEAAVQAYAEHHNIEADDVGRILELMSAEVLTSLGEGKSVVGNIARAMQNSAFELAQANSLFDKDSKLSADETLDKLKTILATVATTLSKASKGFAFTGDEVPKGGVGSKPQLLKASGAGAGVQ
jgi:hypothetical protein